MAGLSSNWKQLSSKISKPSSNNNNNNTTHYNNKKKKSHTKAKEDHIQNSLKNDKHLLQLKHNRVNKDGFINASPLEFTLWTTIGNNEIKKENIPTTDNTINKSEKDRRKELGKIVAIDCEFVGAGEGRLSHLARVTIVNFYGHVVLDQYVQPRLRVTDWRTWVSGITPWHMQFAIKFDDARARVEEILKDRVLVGHALENDLDKLCLTHPKSLTRDTSTFPPFRAVSSGRTPGLKKLVKQFLDLDIQNGVHNPIEDARATMLLYRLQKNQIEAFAKSIK
ncbi:REX4 [Candida theae]|uniref:RNA exonuclease 4 n=1 Tax=Candida theae TaxID=1198502 RepID=A0AAD5BHN2_9ASCO|nr:REX4 [Candida theae]KAI5964023.1 REX4 [Candida theae]